MRDSFASGRHRRHGPARFGQGHAGADRRGGPGRGVALVFFYIDPPTSEIYTLSLHDALPISARPGLSFRDRVNSCQSEAAYFLVILRRQPKNLAGKYHRSSVQRPSTLPRSATALAVRQDLRSEEHTSELQSQFHLVCRLLLEK